MPSFLPHAVAPVLLAAAVFPVPRRTMLLLAPVVWLPDVDYLVPAQHRAATHSVLVPLLLLAAVVALWRRRDPAARFWEFATRPGAPVALTLSAYYVASHVLMDVFAGGVVLLWPLSWTMVYLEFAILLDTGTNTFEPVGDAGTEQGAPALTPVYPWMSPVDTAVAAFLVAVGVGALAVRAWRKGRGTLPPRPVVLRRPARALPASIHKR